MLVISLNIFALSANREIFEYITTFEISFKIKINDIGISDLLEGLLKQRIYFIQ